MNIEILLGKTLVNVLQRRDEIITFESDDGESNRYYSERVDFERVCKLLFYRALK